MKTHIVIDGDILAYTAAASVEKVINWGDDFFTLHSDFAEAKSRVDVDIVEFVEKLGGDSYTVCFTDHTNFRKGVYPEYKSNRKATRKPICFVELRAYINECWPCQTWKNLEADDVMGIYATGKTKSIIVSADKDMKTIPGRWFNPNNPDAGVITVTTADANRTHLIQTLTGDRVDGYPGCPGIGPVRAEKIVDEGGWGGVLETYAKAGLSASVAITQARCAYILRKGDYVKKTGRVRLWEPSRV